MIIVSNVKEEGILFIEGFLHVYVEAVMDRDNNKMYSLRFNGEHFRGFCGEWDTREKAQDAIDEIVKAYHLGNREVILK